MKILFYKTMNYIPDSSASDKDCWSCCNDRIVFLASKCGCGQISIKADLTAGEARGLGDIGLSQHHILSQVHLGGISRCNIGLLVEYSRPFLVSGVMEILNNNKSKDFYDIKTFAQMNYWTRRKVFSFVSHQNVLKEKSFPCNTVGGSKTGKPCSFPFIYQSIGQQERFQYQIVSQIQIFS